MRTDTHREFNPWGLSILRLLQSGQRSSLSCIGTREGCGTGGVGTREGCGTGRVGTGEG